LSDESISLKLFTCLGGGNSTQLTITVVGNISLPDTPDSLIKLILLYEFSSPVIFNAYIFENRLYPLNFWSKLAYVVSPSLLRYVVTKLFGLATVLGIEKG